VDLRTEADRDQLETEEAGLINRLKIVEAIRDSDNKPEWMVLDVIPVIRPTLASAGAVGSGNFVHQRLERLYRRDHQPQTTAEEAGGPQRAGSDHPQRKRMCSNRVDALFEQQPLQAARGAAATAEQRPLSLDGQESGARAWFLARSC